MFTTEKTTTAPAVQTKETVEQLIANLLNVQGRLTPVDGDMTSIAFNAGYSDGLATAIAYIKMKFAAELAPATESVKDWSNVPANERPELVINSQSTWAAMWPEFTPKFEKAA